MIQLANRIRNDSVPPGTRRLTHTDIFPTNEVLFYWISEVKKLQKNMFYKEISPNI